MEKFFIPIDKHEKIIDTFFKAIMIICVCWAITTVYALWVINCISTSQNCDIDKLNNPVTIEETK